MKSLWFLSIFLFGCQASIATRNPSPLIEKKRLLPPRKLYHYGRFDYTYKNTILRQIAQADWDQFIMSNSRSNLSNYRRGFYGCSVPAQCESYGALTLGAIPWINIVTLKNECRQEVALPSYLYQDPGFERWYKQEQPKHGLDFQSFVSRCQYPNRLNLLGSKEGVCEKIVAGYFSEAHVKVVLDEGMPDARYPEKAYQGYNSWYVRDRSCIEKVEGTPEEVLQLLTTDSYWEAAEKGAPRPAKNILFLLGTSVSLVEPEIASKYSESIVQQAIKYSRTYESSQSGKTSDFVRKLLSAHERCRSSSQFRKWVEKFIAPRVLDSDAEVMKDLSEVERVDCR